MYFRRRSEFSGVSRSILDALSWTEEMGNRVVPAFLLIALLVPLPKAISAPFQAASSPFVDVPAAGPDEALAARRTYAAHITAQIRHKVAEGDTLFALALRYNTTVEAIVAVNALPSAHVLRIGQELIMPVGASATARAVASPAPPRAPPAAPAAGRPAAAITYEVQTGDTLFALALRYNTTVDAIVAAHGVPSAHRLRPGQRPPG